MVLSLGCSNREDNPKPFLVAVGKGGCNNGVEKSAQALAAQPDTIAFAYGNDTLSAFVGINYICCARFTASFDFRNDSLLFCIHDDCTPTDQCYCKCTCYYTFDFKLGNCEDRKYPFAVSLYNAQSKTTKVVACGYVN